MQHNDKSMHTVDTYLFLK